MENYKLEVVQLRQICVCTYIGKLTEVKVRMLRTVADRIKIRATP